MMLDKSVSIVADFGKKLVEFRQSEDELKPKLLIDVQDVSVVEMTDEFTRKRLLEAENTSEVFQVVAREMASHLQILRFALNDSLQREAELKFKLQEVENNKNLKDTESMLRQANASNEDSDHKLFEMENYIHSIRERVFVAESRAEAAEAKVSELTELNMELTEELEFLKGTNSDSEKMSLLVEQVRHLEKELQHSKALSESCQEQQKELYMAIWDMETLIEDLKSKDFIAETRSEKLEEQCLLLAETNSELNKQMSDLQSRAESLETSLNEVHREKGSRAKDINNGTKIVADMVMQLALERERIKKTVCSLAKENKLLTEELHRSRKICIKSTNGNKVDNAKEAYSFVNGFPTAIANGSVEELPETSCTSSQVPANDLTEPATSNENEEGSSKFPENSVDGPLGPETLRKQRKGNPSIRFILMTILVLVLSAGAMLTALRHFLSL